MDNHYFAVLLLRFEKYISDDSLQKFGIGYQDTSKNIKTLYSENL